MHFVPVKSKDGEKLMPTTPTRAGMMIKCGDATPYWDHGVFCIRLNREPSKRFKQDETNDVITILQTEPLPQELHPI